jgi:hypothetical protein
MIRLSGNLKWTWKWCRCKAERSNGGSRWISQNKSIMSRVTNILRKIIWKVRNCTRQNKVNSQDRKNMLIIGTMCCVCRKALDKVDASHCFPVSIHMLWNWFCSEHSGHLLPFFSSYSFWHHGKSLSCAPLWKTLCAYLFGGGHHLYSQFQYNNCIHVTGWAITVNHCRAYLLFYIVVMTNLTRFTCDNLLECLLSMSQWNFLNADFDNSW